MLESILGTISETYFASSTFSAGVLQTVDGDRIRFHGPFSANDGDVLTLSGRWKNDPKYGRQFSVESLCYELPDDADGLISYLAKNPAFVGIGEATASKIVTHAGSAMQLDKQIRENATDLHRQLGIPRSTCETLRKAWIAHSADNDVRSYLAGFQLTHLQIGALLKSHGHAVVGILRTDPYQLIGQVKGYGFKTIDKIARAMGTPKNHEGRIESGLMYVISEEVSSGHTLTAGADLLDKANELLLLDTLDSRDVIQTAAKRLLVRGELVADDKAIATPRDRETEQLIQSTFDSHGWSERQLLGVRQQTAGMNAKQIEAYQAALRYRMVVISGGAGTGKTYVLARLSKIFQDAGLNVALCAPTGKAGKRIEESLRGQGLDLEAKTIHRLLEYDGARFNRDSLSARQECSSGDNEPGIDVVIVDEVSMVDAPLMAELLRRIDFTRTCLVLVGDHNQLPPVGPGNVLRDIIRHKLLPTVILDEVVRQAGVLKTNSMAVLSAEIAPTATNDPAWTVVDVFQDAERIQIYLRELILERIPARTGLDPITDVQIITPTHRGPLGTKAINGMIQRLLHGEVEGRFTVDDRVIQMVNDYNLCVTNGTIGRVVDVEMSTQGGYTIHFDGCGERSINNEQVDNVELAYALTAHKAQGSEFPCVVVLCHKSHFFADRNWLYTAVTRATKHCILIGDRLGLCNAVNKNHTIERRTFLDLWATASNHQHAALEVPA